MRSTTGLFAILAAGAAMPLSAQSNTSIYETVRDAPPIDSTTQAEEIKFKDDANDRMTVPVTLSGQGPFRFLVDTGADRTALSHEVADKLQLTRGKGAKMHSVSGMEMVATAAVPSLQVTSQSIRVPNAALLNGQHMGADGILGVDSLASQRIMFNFKTNTMSVVPSIQRLQSIDKDPDTIVVTARKRNGRLILTNARAQGNHVSIVLDTGTDVSIGNEALKKRLLRPGSRPPERLGEIQLRSVTGDILVGEAMMVRHLRIGSAVLNNLVVVFTNAHTFTQLKLDEAPALLLGMNAMRAFDRVSIDFAKKKLRLIPPEHSALDNVRFASR